MSAIATRARAIIDALIDADPADMRAVMAGFSPAETALLAAAWPVFAHAGQTAPPGDWRTWVMMAGRGFGKTRAGAEWVMELVRNAAAAASVEGVDGHCTTGGAGPRLALVAATIEEARSIMVEGASGLIACAAPGEIAAWSPTRGVMQFAGGAIATLFSGASPEQLRGPEHDYAWCDELAKWQYGRAAWDNLQMGLRRGAHPRVLVTTTPRGGTVLTEILAAGDTVRTGGPTRANRHLPAAFVHAIEASYGGTRLGAQELDGVLLRDVEGSLWPEALLARSRAAPPDTMSATDNFVRIVVGVDPPASVAGTCGIVVCALGADRRGYVLADASVTGVSPEGWARAVVSVAAAWHADRVIVETNQGGDMVKSVLRAAAANVPVRGVYAARGKVARAEPVAALFENGRAVFAGRFPALEAELAGLQIGGAYRGPGASPDRADAMVWALTALMLEPQRGEPRLRLLDL